MRGFQKSTDFKKVVIIYNWLSDYSKGLLINGKEGFNKMQLMGKEALAIASACSAAKSFGMDIRKYELYISEAELSYTISFVDMEKPEGFRGSRTGFPQPVLKVDKNSGEIIGDAFSR